MSQSKPTSWPHLNGDFWHCEFRNWFSTNPEALKNTIFTKIQTLLKSTSTICEPQLSQRYKPCWNLRLQYVNHNLHIYKPCWNLHLQYVNHNLHRDTNLAEIYVYNMWTTIFTEIQTLLKSTSTICEPQSSQRYKPCWNLHLQYVNHNLHRDTNLAEIYVYNMWTTIFTYTNLAEIYVYNMWTTIFTEIQTLLKSTSTICEPQSSQRYKPCWNLRLQYVNHNLHRDTNLAEIYVYNMWTTIFIEIQTLLKSTSTICEPQSSQRYKPCWNLRLQYVNHNLHRDTNLAEIYIYNMWTTIFTEIQTLLKSTSTICEPQSSHIQTLLKSTSTICEPQSSQRYKPCWNLRLQYVNHNLHRDTNLAENYVYNMWTTIFTEIQTLLKSTSTICEPQSSQRYKPCWNLRLQYLNHNLHRDTNLAEIYVYNMWTTIVTKIQTLLKSTSTICEPQSSQRYKPCWNIRLQYVNHNLHIYKPCWNLHLQYVNHNLHRDTNLAEIYIYNMWTTIFTEIQTLLKSTSTICEPQSSHIQTLLKSTSTICEPQSSQRYKPCWNLHLQYVNHNLHRDTNLAEIYVYNMWTTIFTEIQTLLKSTSTICEPQSSQRYKPCWNLRLQYVNHNLHRDTNLAEIYVYNMWTTIFTEIQTLLKSTSTICEPQSSQRYKPCWNLHLQYVNHNLHIYKPCWNLHLQYVNHNLHRDTSLAEIYVYNMWTTIFTEIQTLLKSTSTICEPQSSQRYKPCWNLRLQYVNHNLHRDTNLAEIYVYNIWTTIFTEIQTLLKSMSTICEPQSSEI